MPTQPLVTTHFGQLRLASTTNPNTNAIGFLDWGVAALILTAPVAASSTTFLNAQSANGTLVAVNAKPDFPRNVQVVASGATTAALTINGVDINGYPISEVITLNGATPVAGKKAYSYIISVQVPTVGATTISVGVGTKFGLPNRTLNQTVLIACVDGSADSNLGTLVLGSTSAGTDYYGTWSPATAPNGSHNFAMYWIPTDYQNEGVNN